MQQRIGRYEVVEHLASGGMGRVYLAKMTGLAGFERHVVIKALHVREDDDGLVTMFLDEARVLAALHHHCIAPVYEVGRDPDGRYFLVMDYVHGETVEDVMKACLERDRAVPLPFALTAVSAIASALDYAHDLRAPDGSPLGIVHRDVSLTNVMIGFDGAVKLIDFGIAKSANRSTQTLHGTLKGKIGYLAPEQVRSRPIDRRADIFALGIVLYELTTMTRAFCGASELDTLERITRGEVVPPSELVPDYPHVLERIVMKALAVDPADRYQDAGAMGRDIEALAHELGLQLGHATVAATMRSLFDRARRRFARASSELSPTPPGLALAPALRPQPLPAALDDLPTRRVPTFAADELDQPAPLAEDEVIELRAETARVRPFPGFAPAVAQSGEAVARPARAPDLVDHVPPVVVRFATPVSEVMAAVAPPERPSPRALSAPLQVRAPSARLTALPSSSGTSMSHAVVPARVSPLVWVTMIIVGLSAVLALFLR